MHQWYELLKVPKQPEGSSEINTVTDIFSTGCPKCIPKQRLEYINYDGNSDDCAESDSDYEDS